MSKLIGLPMSVLSNVKGGSIGERTRKAYQSIISYLEKPSKDLCPDLSEVKPYEATTKFADSLSFQTFLKKYPKHPFPTAEFSTYAVPTNVKNPNYRQSTRSKSRLAKDGIIDTFNNNNQIKSLAIRVHATQSRLKELVQRIDEMRTKTKDQVLAYVQVITNPRKMSFIRETSQKLVTFRENWNQVKLKDSVWLRLGTANGAMKDYVHKLYYSDAKAKDVVGLKDKNEVIIKKDKDLFSNRK